MAFVFIKLHWKADPVLASLIFADLNTGEVITKPISLGDEIYLKYFSSTKCIGTERDGSGWISCYQNQLCQLILENFKNTGIDLLETKQLLNMRDQITEDLYPEAYSKMNKIKFNSAPSNAQCYYCNLKEYFACRKICLGNECKPSTPEAKARCNPPETAVYITKVGGEIKVGVSLNSKRRWLEQGSDYAIELALLPGLEARAVEQKIAQTLEIKKQVSTKNKLQYLQSSELNEFDSQLIEVSSELQSIAKEVKDLRSVEGEIFENFEIVDLTKYQGIIENDKHYQEFDYNHGNIFGGRIVALKGFLVIVENNGYYYVLNTKKLISHVFEFSEPIDMKGQKSLNEFF
jgi:hypothetical protein